MEPSAVHTSVSRPSRLVLPSDHGAYPIIAAIAVIVMLVRCQMTVGVFTHTNDEPFHIAAGLGLYEAHKHVVDATHPPVAWLVSGAALRWKGVDVPQLHQQTSVMDFAKIDAVASQSLFEQKLSYWTILTTARKAMLVFPIIAMLYLYQLGKWLANSLVAMLAVLFCTTDPTLLGHAGLVNNDVAAAAAFLAAMYHGLRWIVSPSLTRAAIAGLVFGLAMGTKFTILALFPALVLIAAIRPLSVFFANGIKHPIRSYFSRWPSIAQIGLCAFIGFHSLWATYLFNVGKMQDQTFFDYTPKWNQIPASIRNATIPMPSFAIGLMYQIVHSQSGHKSYLNGILYDQKGSALFFPQSLLMKEPLSAIALAGTSIIAWLMMGNRRPWRSMVMLLPVGVYLIISMSGNVMIGVRHLMPIIPLMYLFACFVLARGRATALVVVLLASCFVETLAAHPDYLPHMNAATGGTKNGLRYFADSNLDWGQDVGRLSLWLRTSPAARKRPYTLRIFAANTRELLTELGLNPAAQDATPRGIFAISKSIRAGFTNFDRLTNGPATESTDYSWLRDYPKIAEIGASIEVYDLGDAPTTSTASAD